MGLRVVALGALVAIVAACGGGDDAATTDSASTRDLVVRVTAELGDAGCKASRDRSGLDLGSGSTLRVLNGSGDVLGVGTFAPSPGLVEGFDKCDWTATVDDVDAHSPSIELDAGGPLATLSQDEIDAADGEVHVHIELSGSPTVVTAG